MYHTTKCISYNFTMRLIVYSIALDVALMKSKRFSLYVKGIIEFFLLLMFNNLNIFFQNNNCKVRDCCLSYL